MTLEGTPLIVSPDGIATVKFLDEAETVNALVPHLQAQGVEAIVVLLHEGGSAVERTGGDPDADQHAATTRPGRSRRSSRRWTTRSTS